ncbi:uncharacterized protein [Eucyclogobius newberryi]|uniref:uncharacterized protein isoform X2 n=1 Tax=Eucyclogobius newberryi TaxID=166745 RepID=UPI003B5AA0D7
MSNRDSLGYGDLLPQDVVEIFAQEKHSKNGRKQQRRRSIGRALGWLKGKKNKNLGDKAQNPGLGPAFDLALDGHPAGHQGAPKGTHKSGKQGPQQSNSHAVPKRDDDDGKTTAPLLLQENVFIEASRPQYLEDLHSEALEGLKFMQQEERIAGHEYQDNESTISTVSARAEVDGGGFTTDSTIPDTSSMVSVQSSVSSRSSRSGLTRQGSTFRPLNSGKKSDKGRTRRRRRKTIESIPQHLQREFGLDRAEWTVSPQLEEEFINGESDVPQLAVHAPPETYNTEVIHPLGSVQKEKLRGGHSAHVDDMALLQRVSQVPSGGDRPWSLAVPGMTTAGSVQPGPPSPVLSMSPQAPYLSKIIPNAVLPPSIDVVEISRGSSRNSVRTVSKSSLMLSSPSSSRASSRASTARSTSSRSSTITSASRQMHFHLSDSSCWSNSDSDTLVSDSSTISSSSTPRQSEAQDKEASKKQVGFHPHAAKGTSNGRMIKGDESKKDGAFVRSLSVMKPKRAPVPPNRSYSLHKKRRSRDLADVKIIPCQTSEGNMNSPGYNADTSSLDESTGSKSPSPQKSQQTVVSTKNNVSTNVKKEESVKNDSNMISPSSGYSSQDAMSPYNSSPKHKKGLLGKLHKLFPAGTSNASIIEKPSVKALRELFSIPPHPKVLAPPPPPPEVWSHSPRSIELLLGPPGPENTYAIVKKNPKDKRPYRQPPSTYTEGIVRSSLEEQRQSSNPTVESKKVHVSQEGSLNVENSERLIQSNVKEHGKVQVSAILNGVLVRTVGNGQRLPAIAEEKKSGTHNTKNPSISSAHISPRLPTKQSAAVSTLVSVQHTSPESSWPPPPPPVSQAGMGCPDETDLPLPPPPVITRDQIVIPAQVPSDKPVPNASNMSTSLQENKVPPLNIPPPPSYTAPAPPTTTFSTLSSPKEEVKPSPSKEMLPVATEVHHSTPAEFTPPAPKLSIIPPPPEASPPPPPQEMLAEVPPSEIIHLPFTIHTLSPSDSNVTPPPDLIPPTPSREVIILPSIVIDLPSQSVTEVSPPPTDKTSEQKEAVSQSDVTNITYLPASEIVTEVSISKPADIPPLPQMESKPPPEQTQEALSPVKETPPPLERLSPTPAEVSSPPLEVTIISSEVSVPPSEEMSSAAQIDITQAPVEIPPIPEESIPPEDVSPQPPIEEHSPPQEVPLAKNLPHQPSEVISPPHKEEPTPAPKAASPLIEILSPPQEVAQTSPEKMPPATKEVTSPVIVVIETCNVQVSGNSLPSVVEESSTFAAEKSLENSHQPSDKEPASPPVSPEPEIELSEGDILTETNSTLPPWKSILTPPQSIPPPPPIEPLIADTLHSKEPEKAPSNEPKAPEEVPPQPETTATEPTEPTTPLQKPVEEVPKQEPISDATEQQTEETAPASTKEELSENANHANDQTVDGNLDSVKAEDESKFEVKTTTQEQETATEVQTSTTPEAPQKPIRKSLIISTPPSPPATVATSPFLIKAPPSTTTATTKTHAPSMNLQEAIRLRTAARSHNGPSTRLSIHSPPGFDVRKSPTCTASFVFSKSNKVVIETKSEAKAEKTVKKEFKKPPPVAKKPKTKSIEAESGDTAGQDAQSDAIQDVTKKPNGTAGTVEGQ